MLADLEHDTVDFIDNYDGKYREPLVLPSKFPNLLVNGSDGIAVGMATDIPPHNLREVCDGLIRLIDNPDVTIDRADGDHPRPGLPDRRHHLRPAGHPRRLHAPAAARSRSAPAPTSTRKGSRNQIIITEVPYPADAQPPGRGDRRAGQGRAHQGHPRHPRREQRTATASRCGWSSTSSATPTRTWSSTSSTSFRRCRRRSASSCWPWWTAGRATLTLKQMLEEFLRHRVQVIRRRTEYLLREAKRRGHVLEGQLIAISSLDEVIAHLPPVAEPGRGQAALAGPGGGRRGAGAGPGRRALRRPAARDRRAGRATA